MSARPMPHLPLAKLLVALDHAIPVLAGMDAAEQHELQARALRIAAGSLYDGDVTPDEQHAHLDALDEQAMPARRTFSQDRIAVTVVEGCTEAKIRAVAADLIRHADAIRDKAARVYP